MEAMVDRETKPISPLQIAALMTACPPRSNWFMKTAVVILEMKWEVTARTSMAKLACRQISDPS